MSKVHHKLVGEPIQAVLLTAPQIPAGMTRFHWNPLESTRMRLESTGMGLESTGMELESTEMGYFVGLVGVFMVVVTIHGHW